MRSAAVCQMLGAFALRNRVLLLQTRRGVPLDVSLGAVPFEERSIERASDWKVGRGTSLRTCSAEDLIVHKAFAARPQDWLDIEGVLVRQGELLNRRLILRELRPLLELKEDESILPRLRKMWKRRQS